MYDLTYIREELKKFEININWEQGIACLDDALSCIRDILDNSNDERERRIAINIMRRYRDMVKEKARGIMSFGTPDIELLKHIEKMMDPFVCYDFGDEAEFYSLKEELSSKLADALLFGVRGKSLKDFDENDKRWLQGVLSKLTKVIQEGDME